MGVPDSVYELVEKFDSDKDRFINPHYNEAQLRQEFVNPFFAALGWEIGNSRQVLHEAGIRSGGTTKHPDYSFLAGHRRAFYVETKKPSVDILNAYEPAHQIRSYGWSGNTEIGILTNFKEFAVYDCRVEPTGDDPPGIARELYLTYEEYLENWEDNVGLFARESVLKRKHRRVLEDKPAGILRVDEAFLRQLESWRDVLAKHIFKQAQFLDITLDSRRLNELVTRTINRIVFLRIAEDRSLEDPGRLDSATRARSNIYSKIKSQFHAADKRYNSGLFHFDPKVVDRGEADELAMNIHINDDVISHIIQDLYPPKSLYQFSVISADILGQVYERFLGKVIEVTGPNDVSVEEKPEVRKAGGVYYTPDYIVDYIVENTVGKLLEGKTPEEVANLRILDPACGSGSFLVGAYQYLLDWHLDYYRKHSARHKNRILHTLDGIVLKTREKKCILKNNIYGVDLDPNAVEVSKLSLFLKMLEHENEATRREAETVGSSEQLLPDLGTNNIKCGNSLIESDFFDHFDMDAFDTDELHRINPFNWHSRERGFGDIMADGGFDAVIGNPPYVRQELLGSAFKDYAKVTYETYAGTADLYTYFIERGVKHLKDNGLFGIIVANKWLRTRYGKPLRRWLKPQAIVEIIDFGDLPVFEQATTYPCILLVGKSSSKNTIAVTQVESLDFASLQEYVGKYSYQVSRILLSGESWSLAGQESQRLLRLLKKKGRPFYQYVDGRFHYGVKTGLNEAFVIDKSTRDVLVHDDPLAESMINPFLAGRDVRRYRRPQAEQFLIRIPNGWTRQQAGDNASWKWLSHNFPSIADHLYRFKTKAKNRYDQGEFWWELRPCDYYAAFEAPKIVYPNICMRPEFSLETDNQYTNQKCFIVGSEDKYLLGILNSQLMMFYFQTTIPKLRGEYFEPGFAFMKSFPVRTINFADTADVAMHEVMVELVDRMLDLHKQLQHDNVILRGTIELQIERTDREIDKLVYKLYDLTPEEIAIVEGRGS